MAVAEALAVAAGNMVASGNNMQRTWLLLLLPYLLHVSGYYWFWSGAKAKRACMRHMADLCSLVTNMSP
jgi:hypothetical protein